MLELLVLGDAEELHTSVGIGLQVVVVAKHVVAVNVGSQVVLHVGLVDVRGVGVGRGFVGHGNVLTEVLEGGAGDWDDSHWRSTALRAAHKVGVDLAGIELLLNCIEVLKFSTVWESSESKLVSWQEGAIRMNCAKLSTSKDTKVLE